MRLAPSAPAFRFAATGERTDFGKLGNEATSVSNPRQNSLGGVQLKERHVRRREGELAAVPAAESRQYNHQQLREML
jgi:hypothetical protein